MSRALVASLTIAALLFTRAGNIVGVGVTDVLGVGVTVGAGVTDELGLGVGVGVVRTTPPPPPPPPPDEQRTILVSGVTLQP